MPDKTAASDEVAKLVAALLEVGMPHQAVGDLLMQAAHATYTLGGGEEFARNKFERAAQKLNDNKNRPTVVIH